MVDAAVGAPTRRPHHPLRAAAFLVAGLLSLTGGLVGCTGDDAAPAAREDRFDFYSPGGQTEIFYAPEERQPIAEFSGEDLADPAREISLSDFDGKVVVLNAWGQWCAPCRAEVDDLQAIHEHMDGEDPDGWGTVLGINVRDFAPEISRDFKKDNAVTYPSIYDPPFRTAAALGGVPASVIPTTVVLDRQHRPAAVFLRTVTDREIIELVDRIRAEEG